MTPWRQAALDGRKPRSSPTGGHVSLADLRARGWTPALVARYLGAHDATKPNPVYANAAPMRLWYEDRVDAAEATNGWVAAQRRAARRQASARVAVETRRARTVAWAESLPIQITPGEDPLGDAIAWYNAHTESGPARRDSDQVFLNRLLVNHLRHQATRYEDALESAYGRTGVEEARRVIRRRVYTAIATRFPHLRAECDNQLRARGQDPFTDTEAIT